MTPDSGPTPSERNPFCVVGPGKSVPALCSDNINDLISVNGFRSEIYFTLLPNFRDHSVFLDRLQVLPSESQR